MSGNHFLLSLTQFKRFVEPNPSYATEYSGFQLKATWESDTVEVTQDAAGTEGRLPYTNDPANPFNNSGQQDPQEYNNVPLYIDGTRFLAHNIKYENSGNQAPYYAVGGGTNYPFTTFADGARAYIQGGIRFAIVRPASGGPEQLLVEFNQEFMDNLAAQSALHGEPRTFDIGFTTADGTTTLNSGQGAQLASATMNSNSGAAFPCFTRGTLLFTDRGEIAVEDLRPGDLVLTADHGLRPIRWIGSRKLDAIDLQARPNTLPVRIKAGSLGNGYPLNDLLVSPQHRILVRSKLAQRMMGAMEVLVAAKHLLALDGVAVADEVTEVEYFHILFDRHEIVWANGTETESLYIGPEAAKAVGDSAMEEIITLFPHLQNNCLIREPLFDAARQLSNGKQARELVTKHIQKNRAILTIQ